VTVSYKSIAGGHVLWHGFFDDLDQMQRALTPEGMGSTHPSGFGAINIFRIGSEAITIAWNELMESHQEKEATVTLSAIGGVHAASRVYHPFFTPASTSRR
jgi:hypothetical protein